MVVCFCLNNLGSLGLGASLNSLIKHCSDSSRLALYFLCSHVDGNIKQAIVDLLFETGYKGKHVFIDFDARKEFGKYRSLQNDWTTYGRLLIPNLIDEEKVLYLDTDLLIETDVLDIHIINTDNFAIAAVPSTPIQYALEHDFFCNTLKIDPSLKVFNAGVLVMNIKNWKTNGIQNKIMAIANAYPQELLSADQALLNAFFAGNFYQLPSNYNGYWYPNKKSHIERNAIYHFVGSPKPWDFFGKHIHSGYKKWMSYTSDNWCRNVLDKNKASQLKRFWAIRRSYVKMLMNK